MGIVYDIPQIPEITMAMSNMYRYSIKGDNMVPLREELGCIKEYMKIMDIRFGGKFEISYKIEDRFLEWETLRMILQPVVENSVYHGMERRSGKGKLVIEAGVSDTGQFVLKVQDNGCGMSKEQLEKLRLSIRDYEHMGIYSSDKRSIGLSNINKRIKLQFGAEYGLSVESKEQKGTTVTLILPVITGKEDFANGAEGTATHQ